jgi:F-type H+-transporting ATPase subunit epsilon
VARHWKNCWKPKLENSEWREKCGIGSVEMSNTIRCDIVSAQEEIFSGQVALFVATGTSGELGIYPHHAPLMTTLKPGPLKVVLPDNEEAIFFVGGGILEVMPHLITVLTDTAIRADHLDEAAALRAKEEAERQLADRKGEMEIAQAMAKMAEAMAKLHAIEELRKKLKT